jgi:hypothetical protein
MRDHPRYFTKILIVLSQLLNVAFLNGYPDEMLSARAYREDRVILRNILDLLFSLAGQKEHCKECYEWEKMRNDLPFYTKNIN